MMKSPLRLLCSCLCLLILFGCSQDPQKKGPGETALAFLEALRNNDYERAKKYCTPGTAEKLNLAKSVSAFGFNPYDGDYVIVQEEINGDYARVNYRQGDRGEEKLLKLRNTEGKWEVMASKADLSAEPDEPNFADEFAKGFSEGMEEAMEGLKEGMEEFVDGLDSAFSDFPDGELEVNRGEDQTPTGEKYAEFRKGKSPAETATAFLKALQYKDYEGAKRYASKGTAEVLEMKAQLGGDEIKDFEIVEVVEDGDYRIAFYAEEGLNSVRKEIKLGVDSKGNWEVIMSKEEFNDL